MMFKYMDMSFISFREVVRSFPPTDDRCNKADADIFYYKKSSFSRRAKLNVTL